jgi:putative ABC transport system permease protein
MNTLLQDLKYALRMHMRTRGFTVVSILTLALGIGAATAVFTIVDAVLLKPLPYPDPDRIVIPWRLAPVGLNLSYDEVQWGEKDFELFRMESKTFQDLGAFRKDSFNLTGVGDPVRLAGLRASVGFFSALSVTPALGRIFTAEEDQIGHKYEVVLGHQLWQDRFGGNSNVLGQSVKLNGDTYTIIGVMPAGFAFPRAEEMPGSFGFPRETQLWVPLALLPGGSSGPAELAIIGRLRQDATLRQAQAEMDLFARREDSEFPRAKGWFNSRVTPLARTVVGDTRSPLLLLLAAVGVVLLVVCSNVASLLLVQFLARKRELTMRTALGAAPARLIRQLLTESAVLAIAGGLVGFAIAWAGVYFTRIFGPSNIPRLHEVSLDLRVFVFAFGITMVAGILLGLVPALWATRGDPIEAMKEGGQRSGGSSVIPKLRNALLVLEVALALVLAIAAGLLIQTFVRLHEVEPGFDATHVITFELSLPPSQYPDNDHIVAFYKSALQRMRALPGVESAAIVGAVPMGGAPESTVVRILGHPVADDKEKPFASYSIVSPGYFSTMGTSLLRGRDFLETDVKGVVPVTIINSAMAKRFWPVEDPIGKQIDFGSSRFPAMTIVGIVADVKQFSLKENPSPEMYVPFTQEPWPSMLVMQSALRTKGDSASIISSVREAIHSVDKDLPLSKVATLSSLVELSVAQPRFAMLLLAFFGALALLLASIGMYSVISYAVAQRTREIGVRMALGAQRSNIFGMVIGQGARLAGLGITIGLAGALGATRLMSRFLYGIGATDLLTFVSVSVLLATVALVACFLPARSATRVDPMVALRHE